MTSINSEQGYALLEAIIDKQPDCPLLQAFLGSRGGVGCEPNALMEHLELLTSTQLELFWSKINELTVCSSTKVGLAEDSDEDVRDNAAGSQEWTDAIGTLLKISQIVIGFIERSKSRPKSLFTTLVTLHDMLTLLNCDEENENVLQAAIAKACETWWHMNEHGRELVVTQLIAYLLLRAVDHDHSDAFVKRLFGVRACFQLLDFDDDSIESIRGLILRCFVHPRFLKTVDGRRFLANTFTFHAVIQDLAVEVIKPQVAAGTAVIAGAYGDVLIRGWRDTDSSPALRRHAEDLLQSLAHAAIHAKDQRYFEGLREMLRSFHDSKRLKEVDSLLLRMYGPILWRSLRCANAKVRVQAATLFFDAFPIQDGNATATSTAENDHLLQSQFELLKTLLEDGDHRVRAVAASGCCRVLSDFWEAIPPAITHQLLAFIAGKLGSDVSSSIVRLAVVHGLHALLNNPRSHATLKSVLPAISNLLHDTSDKVRAGFVKILNKVKSIRGFRFYDIVPIDILLNRLAADESKPAVCEAMTELLLNSFYPQESPDRSTSAALGPLQAQRCLSFLAQNETAALVFYSNFYKFTSVGSAIKMCVLLLEVLVEAVSGTGAVSCMSLSQGTDGANDDFDVKSAENRKVNSNSIRSEKAKKLLARAKRRRESEVEKVAEMDVTIGGEMLRGVMKAIVCIAHSVSSKLSNSNHRPSKDMFIAYFNFEKITSLLPLVIQRGAEDDMDVIMNATFFMQIVNEVVASHALPVGGNVDGNSDRPPHVTPQYVQLSMLCLSSLFAIRAECPKLSPVHLAPLGHAVVSIICRLKCEDVIVSIVKAVGSSDNFFAGEATEWSPTGKAGRSCVSIDSSDFLLVLSAIINGSDVYVLSLRERLSTEKDLKLSLWDTFSRAQNASLAMPLSSPLVEYIQLGSLYASVVCVAKGRDTSIVEKCCDWAFSVLTPHLASSLERGDADAVSTYVELACAAALPLSDLLSCHEAVSCLARSVTAWVKCLTALNMKSGEAAWASLVSLFNVCCRFCCLFAQVEAAVNDESLALACEVAWKMCMTFLIQFADQIDTLGQKLTIEKLSSLRKNCQYALHSLLQYITSHPNLGKFADEAMYMLILASVYSMRISFENQMPVIIECICNKTKYSTAARTSAQKLLGAVKESNSIMISTGIDFLGAFVSRDTATSLINCNKVEALCGIFHA